jgi:ABC-2 type transport system ATP-binding protein
MNGSGTVVEIQGITKRFAGHTAVRRLSLSVPPGSVYGLLGPNGAGKTTTIRMIMDIIVPDEGRVTLFGNSGTGRDFSAKIGYLPEERGLYKKMKVFDLLVFLAEAKGVDRRSAKREAHRWLERLGLVDWEQKKIDDLSKGMQQKVQFISTVLHAPELLILDEPFSGFDPVNTQLMKDVVVELSRAGTTVLFSTHIMEQAERLCDSVCIIARGEKVLDGPLAEVKRGHGGRHLIVAVEQGSTMLDELLRDSALVAKADDYGQYAEVELTEGGDPQQLLQRLVSAGARVGRFEIAEPTLHKIFIDIVGREAAEAPAEEVRADA